MMSVIASSDTVSIVKLASFMIVNAMNNEDGIAIKTTIELRHDRKKNSMTMPVRTMPCASVRQTAWICCCGIGHLHVEDREIDAGVARPQFRQRGEDAIGSCHFARTRRFLRAQRNGGAQAEASVHARGLRAGVNARDVGDADVLRALQNDVPDVENETGVPELCCGVVVTGGVPDNRDSTPRPSGCRRRSAAASGEATDATPFTSPRTSTLVSRLR